MMAMIMLFGTFLLVELLSFGNINLGFMINLTSINDKYLTN
jgi:hypothetical protein